MKTKLNMNTSIAAFIAAHLIGFPGAALAEETRPDGATSAPATQKPAAAAESTATAPDTIDPKAEAIYDRSVAVIKGLGTLEFTSETKLSDSGDLAVASPPADIGDPVRFVVDFRSDDKTALYQRIYVERTQNGRVVESLVHDGTRGVAVNHEKKNYLQTPDGMEVSLGKIGILRFMRKRGSALDLMLSERDISGVYEMPGYKVVGFALVGEEAIDGVTCDIVRKTWVSDRVRTVSTVAIARTDGLPRRIESSNDYKVGFGTRWEHEDTLMKLTSVRANGPVEDGTFSTTPPEGYTDEGRKHQPKEYKVSIGDAAPDFALSDLAGQEVTLASLKGKVVLLDFWASWCGPCLKIMPTIQKICDDYKGKDLVVLGVNTFERIDDAGAKVFKRKGHTYGCLLKGDNLAAAYGITGIPVLVVIDRNGKVALIGGGSSPLRQAIDKAMDAK